MKPDEMYGDYRVSYMVQIYACRSGAPGASCLTGSKEQLILAFGAAALTRTIPAVNGIHYSVLPGAVTIQAGGWIVFFDVTTSSGGGPVNTIRVDVVKFSVACAIQTTIMSVFVNTVKGTTQEYNTGIPIDPGALVFLATDILQLTFIQTNGSRVLDLRYDDVNPSDADSRISLPNLAGDGSEHGEGDGIWLDLGGPGPLGEY